MLEQIFSKVVDMSLGAGMIIIIVFIVRLLLKRFPKYITYMLWSVVLFRLLCPFTFESKISIVPDLKPAFYEYALEKDDVLAEASGDFAVPYTGGEGKNVSEAAPITPSQSQPDRNNVKNAAMSWQELFILFGKYVWISGIGVMLLYCVTSFVKIRNKVRVSIPFKENILITDEPVTPFVMGIFHPKIYLPGCLSEKEQEYIILHEQFHIRRFDHIVKPVAFAALCLHWFNPLVWIAFTLFCKDMEMSCDEAVIKKLGENIRADYSASLLALSTQHGIVRGLPVEFGEGDTKSRVKNLAAFRKTKKGVLVVLTAGVIILIVCLSSTHKTSISGENGSKDQIHGHQKATIDYIDFLTDYEGYLDNVEVLDGVYAEQDYDQDKKKDRILQYFMDNGEKMYAICFGNGKVLQIGPFEDTMMQINLYATDLTGDGKNEIIFCGFHAYSDYPYEKSEIAIWTPTKNEYKPLSITASGESDSYEAGYPIFIEKTDKDHEILISCEELGLAEKYQIPKDEQETFDNYYSYLQSGEKNLFSSAAWNISVEKGSPSTLTLYEDILYRLSATLKMNMKWDGNKFEVIKTSILKERPGNHTSESIEEGGTSEVQESKYTNEEIKKIFFGEWEVSKLLGFSEVQNDYSNYPEGHDIIGNHILINENAFSSEGLEKYERYQCEVLNPTYEVSDIKYDYPIYYVNESVKEETELYNMIMNEEFQELEIKGNCPSAVQIMVSADNQLVILTMDGAYYLLEKIL